VSITPSRSGKILVIINGNGVLSGSGEQMYARLYYNTSVASGHDVPPTGFTQLGSEIVVATNTQNRAFTISSVVTGLTIDTTYYFDLAIYSSGNTATASSISVSIVEL